MLTAVQKFKDDSLFFWLNEIPNAEDAVINNIQYHRTCRVFSQRNAKSSDSTPQEQVIDEGVIADKDESSLKENHDIVLDMRNIDLLHMMLKRYLNQLLE